MTRDKKVSLEERGFRSNSVYGPPSLSLSFSLFLFPLPTTFPLSCPLIFTALSRTHAALEEPSQTEPLDFFLGFPRWCSLQICTRKHMTLFTYLLCFKYLLFYIPRTSPAFFLMCFNARSHAYAHAYTWPYAHASGLSLLLGAYAMR